MDFLYALLSITTYLGVPLIIPAIAIIISSLMIVLSLFVRANATIPAAVLMFCIAFIMIDCFLFLIFR